MAGPLSKARDAMELVVPLVLLVGVFLAVDVLWCPPSWLRARAAARPQPARVEDAAVATEWHVVTLPQVRRRLGAVADELERLDRDPAVFARAFRTFVARSAYEALLAEESRLSAVPSLELTGPRAARPDELALDLPGAPTSRREELVL